MTLATLMLTPIIREIIISNLTNSGCEHERSECHIDETLNNALTNSGCEHERSECNAHKEIFMLSLEQKFISSYSKSYLEDWSVIAKIINQKGRWTKENIEIFEAGENPLQRLLSDQKINDAFNGPLQDFFKLHLAAYARIAKIETVLTLTKEDYFKDSEGNDDLTLGLPNFLIERSDFSTLKTLKENLNTQTKTHHEEWERKEEEWKALIIAELKVIDVQLSDMEQQDLTTYQPVSELADRFTNLKLSMPNLPKNSFNFQQYWLLKSTLAIQSVYGRLQLACNDKIIEEKLKQMKNAFKKIIEAEKALFDPQKAAIKKLLDPITPPGEK